MNRIKRLALICAVLWLIPQAQATAQAATYLNEAVQALQSGNVYVSAEVTDINPAAQKELAQQANANNVAVVALPEAAATEAGGNPTEFALSIARSTGDNTLVLAIGDDLVAVSRDLQPGVAAKLADQVEADAGSTGEALLNFITEVRDAQPGPSSSQPIADGGGSGVWLVMLVVLFALVAGLGAVRFVRRQGTRQTPELIRAPEEVEKLLSQIRDLGVHIKDPETRQSLSDGKRHTEQLFSRLKQTGSNQIQQITATYVGHLNNLLGILEQLKEIQDYPEAYQPETSTLLNDGRKAVLQYEAGVLQNLRDEARGSLTNFRVNARLLSAMNPPQDPKL